MESQFRATELRFTTSVTYFSIVVLAIFTVVGLIMRCLMYGWFQHPGFALGFHFIPFSFLIALLVTIRLPCLQGHIYYLLCTTNLLMVGWMAFSIPLLAEEDIRIQKGTVLAEVFDVLHRSGNPAACAALEHYIGVELGRKYFGYTVILNYLHLDLLMLLGMTWMSVLVFFSVPISLWIVSHVSTVTPSGSLEVLSYALIMCYTLGLNYYFTLTRRWQFASNYQLQRSLEKEAASLKEIARHEAALKEASREADSILNHVLKNVMADAAGCIHLYLQATPAALPSPPADLLQATECLQRGVAWCRKRQALLRIASGHYAPQPTEVDLNEFGRSLLQGRPIDAEFPNEVVTMDPLLCEIVLENALTNAHRHGHPSQPRVRFTALLTPLTGAASPRHRNRRRLTFSVTNRAHPSRLPLTPEAVTRLLNAEELVPEASKSRLSEHLGMRHLTQAARAHDMEVDLFQVGDVVYFEATLEVVVVPFVDPVRPPPADSPPAVPPNLRVFCVDDSPVARRLLSHTLSGVPMCAMVTAIGETPEEVTQFLQEAACGADIVILDYHLDYGSASFLGTDVLRTLLARGFRGFSCIRSANASPHEETLFIEAGAHCCIGKDVHPGAMAKALMAAYLRWRAVTDTLSPPPLPAPSPSLPPEGASEADSLNCVADPLPRTPLCLGAPSERDPTAPLLRPIWPH
eukprot:EG_transcript_4857